uniref:dihydropteroate synthase n=1 Tax=Yoonia sp. TaxID=2212373 RepID=UPI00404814F6
LTMDRARIMGILNVTPDSFSDGGDHADLASATARALAMQADGAEIIDIGGESTRPGAVTVAKAAEISRTAPVIAAIRAQSAIAISIDTRKADVAKAAIAAGASMVNDVAAFSHDPALAQVTADAGLPVCLMHAQGDPATMQNDPRYDDVLLDVYDFLAARIAQAEAAGIARDAIVIDPGIGFGKTQDHNLTLLRNVSLFHALGCPILLGASRKRFIGTIGGGQDAKDRVAGSVAVALHGLSQGVQILRVHDTFATKQALALWSAINGTDSR